MTFAMSSAMQIAFLSDLIAHTVAKPAQNIHCDGIVIIIAAVVYNLMYLLCEVLSSQEHWISAG